MPRKSPTIALCVIARDEERFIAECLDSARGCVDEVILVDTGSSDRTREIAREHGARVEEFAWCDDFAAARNAAIEFATADWILMLDADERLQASSRLALRRLVANPPRGAHAFSPRIENRRLSELGDVTSTVAVPRIFPRRTDLRFVGAIHEVISYLPDPVRTVSRPAEQIRIVHYGYDGEVYDAKGKDARNRALLERELERNSTDPRMPFFLLQQHVIGGRNAEAVAMFEQVISQAGRLPAPFLVQSYQIYLHALMQLHDREGVERAAADAAQRGLLGAAALDLLSAYFAEAGELDRGIEYLQMQLNTGLPVGLEHTEGRGSWATRIKLAELLEQRGEPERALEEVDRAFRTLPNNKRGEVAALATAFALQFGEPDVITQWGSRAIKYAADTLAGQQQLASVLVQLCARAPEVRLDNAFVETDRAMATYDLQRAYDLACETSPDSMAGLARMIAVIKMLSDADEHEAALGVLNRALDGPRSAQVHWLLVQTLTKLGRYQEAQLALAALRQLQSPQGEAKAA